MRLGTIVLVLGASIIGIAISSATPVRIGTYYEETEGVFPCTFDMTAVCSLPFRRVPAGKQLTITRVACNIQVEGDPTTIALGVKDAQGQVARLQPVTPTYVSQVNTTKFFSFNTQTLAVLPAGTAPLIWSRFVGTNVSLNCQIAGAMDNAT